MTRFSAFGAAGKMHMRPLSRPLSQRRGSDGKLVRPLKDGKLPHKFLVLLDGSTYSLGALAEAKRLMKIERGDTLILLTVPPLIELNPALTGEMIKIMTSHRDAAVHRIMSRAEKECADIVGHYSVMIEAPASGPRQGILDAAEREDVDYIVLGSRGMGAIARVLRGSTSEFVVTHSPRTVIVVKEEQA